MSVRNIRNHQSRGLLPPPEVRARTGYYGPEHVERLRLIQEMQAEGFNLKAIKRLLGEQGAVGRPLRRAAPRDHRAVRRPRRPRSSPPRSWPSASARRRRRRRSRRPSKLGILVPLGDGRFEVPSPALLRAAEEVVARGIAARRGARASIERDQAQRRSRVARSVRRAVPRRGLEAVRGGRPARGALAGGHRVDRAPAAAGVRGAARDVPADDGRGGRGRVRQGARAAGQEQGLGPAGELVNTRSLASPDAPRPSLVAGALRSACAD